MDENEDGTLDSDEMADAQNECKPEIIALVPLWGNAGCVRQYVGGVWVPYGCTSGGASYSIDARFGAVPFSGKLKGAGDVSPAVQAFVKSLPSGTSLGGVSTVPASAVGLPMK